MSKPKIDWISETEAAQLMSYKPRTFRRYCKNGKLPINYTRVNPKTFEYNRLDIEKWKLDNSTITLT
jgi:predicted site-specific integrase-resolvase